MHGPNPEAHSSASQSSAVVVAVVVCEVVAVVVGVVVVVVVALVVCVVVGVVESQRSKPDGQSLLFAVNGRHLDAEFWQTPAVPTTQPSHSATSSSSRHRLKLGAHVRAVTFLHNRVVHGATEVKGQRQRAAAGRVSQQSSGVCCSGGLMADGKKAGGNAGSGMI